MIKRILYATLVTYAWVLALFIDPNSEYSMNADNPGAYAVTVAPAVILIGAALAEFSRLSFDRISIVLLCFAAAVGVVSVLRGDFPTLLSVGALSLALVAFRQSGMRITCNFINALMIASILVTEVMFLYGGGRYGVLSGQAINDVVAWRASLFPYSVTSSWLFALIVVVLNYFHVRPSAYRLLMMAIGLYFVVVSASRTGLIVLVLCLLFLALTRFVEFRARLIYKLFIPLALVAFVISLNAEVLLSFLSGVNNPILNAVLFKSTEGVGGIDEASTSIVRTFIWTQHMLLFAANPLVGQGTFSLLESAPEFQTVASTGSESFLTSMFARLGILAALFVYFVYLLAVDAARRRDRSAFCLVILLSITMLAYGSYLVPYDFVFLVLFGAMNYSRAPLARRAGALAAQPETSTPASPRSA